MRIACVVASMRAGGAERVLAGLTAGLSKRGFHCTIVCLQPTGEAPFYALDDRVRLERLDALTVAGVVRWSRALWRLRRALSAEPFDAVLAFTTVGGVLAAAALVGWSGPPLIIAERTDPVAHGNRIGWLARQLRALSYARATRIVVQTEQARRAISAVKPLQRGTGASALGCGVAVIANPVTTPGTSAQPDRPTEGGRFRLAAAGRLVDDKGFDRLLSAFAQLDDRFPEWDLIVYGDGPLKARLLAQATELAIGSRVTFAGTAIDLNAELQGAHLFVLSSRLEGFANVLAEAGALGLPSVAYRGVGGVAELIVPNVTGLLADPADPISSLADQLAALMADPDLRAAAGTAARQHLAQFSPVAHDDAWAALIATVATSRPSRPVLRSVTSEPGRRHVRDHRALAPRR
jgi:glycosyltransferase involved in cell wall biosynthesis